jgi:hypothetical protein
MVDSDETEDAEDRSGSRGRRLLPAHCSRSRFQQGAAAGKFYERGPVRIYYEEAGSGFPLLLLPPGGLNARIAGVAGNNPIQAMRSTSSRESIAASRRTFATRPAANPPVLSKSIGRGTPMPTTNSVSWIISGSTGSR